MSYKQYLYALQFSVGPSEGMALVVAENSTRAFQYVKSLSEKSYYNPDSFILNGNVNIAEYCGLREGIVFETFVNAVVAYDAIRSMAPDLKGEKGDKGDRGVEGPQGPAGRGIKSVTQNADYSLTFKYTDNTEYTTSSFKVDVRYNTTSYWDNLHGYIPKAGEIIIYSDADKYDDGLGHLVDVPRIKIGSGNAYVQDLVFADQKDHQMLIQHVQDAQSHVTVEDKAFWSAKLNILDDIIDETLVFNRN
jgi:hypothetical protein